MPRGRISVELTILYEAEIHHPEMSLEEMAARFVNMYERTEITDHMERQGASIKLRGITEIPEVKSTEMCERCEGLGSYRLSEDEDVEIFCVVCKGFGAVKIK